MSILSFEFNIIIIKLFTSKMHFEHNHWYFESDDKNPLSLVMLKKIEFIDLNLTDGKELPNFIFMQKLS